MQLTIDREECLALKEYGKKRLINKKLVIVLNQVNKTFKRDSNHPDTDFFSSDEVKQFSKALQYAGIAYEIISNETEAIKKISNRYFNQNNCVIWNLTRQGSNGNKKSIITSIADFYKIDYVGSTVEAMNLARDKHKFEKLLLDSNLTGIQSFSISSVIPEGLPRRMYIYKKEEGAASVGMNSDSVFTLSSEEIIPTLKDNPGGILERLIEGYEIEVPLLKTMTGFKALPPVGIEMNNHRFFTNKEVLDESISENYDYTFYDFFHELCSNKTIDANLVLAIIISQATKIASELGLSSYARVDFRVDASGTPYCFDVASTPYFISHSSPIFDLNKIGLTQSDFMLMVLGGKH